MRSRRRYLERRAGLTRSRLRCAQQPSPVTHASLLHALDSASISWFHVKARLAVAPLSVAPSRVAPQRLVLHRQPEGF
jgi:hypothetical protein